MGYDAISKARSIQFAKDNYKRIPLEIAKADYDGIKAAAIAANQSVNAYVKQAIRERQARESATPSTNE